MYFLGSFHALRETRSLSGIQSEDNGDTLGIWKKREGMKEVAATIVFFFFFSLGAHHLAPR